MLSIDLLTTYVICGAASCAGALMTALARTGDAQLASALRRSSLGFAVLGLSLLQLVLGADGPMAPTMLLALGGTSVGMAIVGWGLATLAGAAVRPGPSLALLVAVLLAQAWAGALGPMPLGVVYSTGIAVLCLVATRAMAGFVLRPRNWPEALLGWAMVGWIASYALRAALAAAHDGPPHTAHAYGPEWVLRLLGILYGVMPVVMATLLLSVVNARLAGQLALRASTDELTGVLNRRALREAAPPYVERSHRAGKRLAVLLLDIDHFKSINDTYGHLTGDAVLRQLAALLQAELRRDALITRFGGEEFALVLPVPEAAAAVRVAERLRAAIACRAFETGSGSLRVTASLGLTLLAGEETLEAALQRADEALYRAKGGGRNRVELAQDLQPGVPSVLQTAPAH